MLTEQTMPLDFLAKPIDPLVILPLIDGMDEWEVTYATCQLRRAGVRVVLASLHASGDYIKGKYGMQFLPDVQLSQCEIDPALTTLLLTGGTACVQRLLGSAELLPYFALAGMSVSLTDVPSGFAPPPSWFCRHQSPLPLFIASVVEALD